MLSLTLGDATGPLTVLCVGAHSDDIEIGCGATLLRLLAERPGSSVHWVVMSASSDRADEAAASAESFLAGAAETSIILHSFRDAYFPFMGAEIKDAFEDLKASIRPDVVFTHRRHDEHQDHQFVARLTWNTFRDHLIAEYEIPKYEGDLGQPNLYVPVSERVAERKIELLMEHFASQRSRRWFRPETFRGLMAVRGVECNAADGLAEAFYVRKAVL